MPGLKFCSGEKVLCFHGPLLYNAVCLIALSKTRQNVYLIHYQVKNPRIADEWVPENRILLHNENNVRKQREIQIVHNKTNRLKKMKSKTRLRESELDNNHSSTSYSFGVFRKNKYIPGQSTSNADHGYHLRGCTKNFEHCDRNLKIGITKMDSLFYDMCYSDVKSGKYVTCKIDISVAIPPELKAILVDDRDLICHQKNLVVVPAKMSVKQILESYQKYEMPNVTIMNDRSDVTCHIEKYFNALLGSRLLYKFERLQYAQILQTNRSVPMSKLYGAVHLLRSFVKIGSILQSLPLYEEDETDVQSLLNHVHGIMNYIYLAKLITLDDYGLSPPEYRRQIIGAD